MREIKINDKVVGEVNSPYIIAEAGINHNGDIEIAKELIRKAKEIGADAVKFQSFTVDCMMTKDAASAAHLEAGAGKEDVYSFVKRISLDEEAHKELFNLAKEVGIEFISTPFSFKTVDWLENLGVAAYKIASMDLNNLPLIEYVAKKNKPMILSTGMGTLAEVDNAVQTIYGTGNQQVMLLHCVSLYPPLDEDINLKAMDTLREIYNCPMGFSDHTIDNLAPLAAVARGANIIEKHFTLDRNMPGPDQAGSGDPESFKQLIEEAKRIHKSIGDGSKKPVLKEKEMSKNFRRSIVSLIDIPEGNIITEEMITYKRPGTGISPVDKSWVIGAKARKNIKADTVIQKEYLIG